MSFDKTLFVPCGPVDATTWPTCQKPTMQNLYPVYDIADATGEGIRFTYPIHLYKKDATPTADFGGYGWPGARWNRYLTMLHYCDFYYGGHPMKCDGDPLGIDDRKAFCSVQKPYLVGVGQTVDVLGLTDLCPWLDKTLDNAAGYPWCFIFSDHPQYRTIGSFLSTRLEEGHDWNGIAFYYVPFTLRVLRNVLVDFYVADTILTNDVTDNVKIKIDGSNWFRTSPAMQALFSKTASVVGEDTTKLGQLDGLCSESGLTPEMMVVAYNVILMHATGAADLPSDSATSDGPLMSSFPETTYTFTSLEGDPNNRGGGISGLVALPTVELTYEQVSGVFLEHDARIQFDNIEVTSAVPGVRVRVSSGSQSGAFGCTRYQVDGTGVRIHGIEFDQGTCNPSSGIFGATPIIFSGDFASQSSVYDIHVINSPVGVGVLGSDNLAYAATPVINANGLFVYDLTFTYTDWYSDNSGMRHVYAAIARASGVPIISTCTSIAGPDQVLLENCDVTVDYENVDFEGCVQHGACIEWNSTGACCGRSVIVPQPNCSLQYGCGGSMYHAARVNGNTTCNTMWCGTCKRGESCAVLADNQTVAGCADDRDSCRLVCTTTNGDADDDDYVRLDPPASSGPPAPPLVQGWQFHGDDSGAFYVSDETFGADNTQSVPGIGYGEFVLGINDTTTTADGTTTTINDTTTVEELQLPVVWRPFPSRLTEWYEGITIIPETDVSVDSTEWEYSSSTRLVLNLDRVNRLSTVPRVLFSSSWCVGLDGARLVVSACNVSSTLWYVDPVTTRIHVSGEPTLCLTGLPTDDTTGGTTGGTTHLFPCRACECGSESGDFQMQDGEASKSALVMFHANDTVTCADDPSSGAHNASLTSTPSGPLYAYRQNVTSIPDVVSVGYVVGSSGCLLYDVQTQNWTFGACDANVLMGVGSVPTENGTEDAVYNSMIRQLVRGPLQTVSSRFHGGPLLDVEPLDGCIMNDAVSGVGFGFGAEIENNNENNKIVRGGFGYTSNQPVQDAYGCSGRAVTASVIVQPHGNDFDVDTTGVEVINVTEFTSYFGYEEETFTSDQRSNYEYTLWICVGVVGVMVAVLLCIHFVMFVYGDAYEQKVLMAEDGDGDGDGDGDNNDNNNNNDN